MNNDAWEYKKPSTNIENIGLGQHRDHQARGDLRQRQWSYSCGGDVSAIKDAHPGLYPVSSRLPFFFSFNYCPMNIDACVVYIIRLN